VNGELRQRAVLGDMIWSVGELIERLSREVTLHPGDLLFTGTPAGVGPLRVGDRVNGRIDGLPDLDFDVVDPST
jgi:fumarylpyruvate hydrolase